MGKTTELARDLQRHQAAGTPGILLDLGGFNDWKEASDWLLSQDAVLRWRDKGDGKLVISVDSVDEAIMLMPKLPEQLSRLLEELRGGDRLLLRLASRAASFPSRMGDILRDRFGLSYQELQLAPLTKSDVRLAAESKEQGEPEAFSAHAFMRALDEQGLGTLASRPITLKMLLAERQGPLTGNRIALYEKAVSRLVQESNQRLLDRPSPHIPREQQLQAARTLAAVSMLSGHNTIAVQRYLSTPADQLCLPEVTLPGDDPKAFEAVLSSALFALKSAGTVRWAHREFPEFITSQVLASMDMQDALALLTDPNDPVHIQPQLAATAAWTALLRTDLFEWILSREPKLLLTVGRNGDPRLRRPLIRALLAKMKSGPPDHDWWQDSYRGLDYSELPEDIRPYLDAGMPVWLHREAALIMAANDRHELDDRLTEIIESTASTVKYSDDSDDKIHTPGAIIASCLRKATDPHIVKRLAAIAANPEIPHDIRSIIIRSLWRRQPTKALLSLLTSAQVHLDQPKLVERVQWGLEEALLESEAAAGPVVDWLSDNDLTSTASRDNASGAIYLRRSGMYPDWWVVAKACLLAAARDPAVLIPAQWRKLTEIIARMLSGRDRASWSSLSEKAFGEAPQEGRRKAATEIMQALPEFKTASFFGESGLLQEEDFDFILNQYRRAPSGSSLEEAWVWAIRIIVNPTPENRRLAKSTVASQDPKSAPIEEFFSDEQIARHEAHLTEERERRWAAEFTRERLVAASEARNWPESAGELRKDLLGQIWMHGEPLTASPGWRSLGQEAKDAVLETAVGYLARLAPKSSPEKADVCDVGDAYLLVATASPFRLNALDASALATWLPALFRDYSQGPASALLAERLGPAFPSQVEQVVVSAIERDTGSEDGYSMSRFGIARVGTFTSPAVEDALERMARDPESGHGTVLRALEALLQRDPTRGTQTAFDIMRRRPDEDSGMNPEHTRRQWDQAAAAAGALTYSPTLSAHLDQLLTELSASSVFTTRALGAWLPHAAKRPWAGLPAQDKAAFLLWAKQALPPENSPLSDQASDVRRIRDRHRWVLQNRIDDVTRLLTEDVSDPAVSALYWAASKLNDPWLRQKAEKLATAVRKENWAPPSPHEIRQVLAEPRKRIIATESQLAQVLLQGLDTIAREIEQDANYRAAYWHRQYKPKGKYIPLDEPEFTTRLTRDLREVIRGVSLRQEVELNHKLATVLGSEADIEAIARDGDEEISVVIEVKGIWHDEVEKSIETQLHDRYLTGAHTHTGIYVVAAYRGGSWLETDYRRDKADGQEADKLRAFLTAKAKKLTLPPKAVHLRVIDIPLDPEKETGVIP